MMPISKDTYAGFHASGAVTWKFASSSEKALHRHVKVSAAALTPKQNGGEQDDILSSCKLKTSGKAPWLHAQNTPPRNRDKDRDILITLPLATSRGQKKLQYVWDGRRIVPVEVNLLANGATRAGHIKDWLETARERLQDAFLPNPKDVTSDYWEWTKWRLIQRFFSSVMHNFATQSLLMAVGVGAKKSLAASAAINWLLKDGVGRVARMTVATNFGHTFDADLKRMRFVTSVLFTACMSCEFLTPLLPRHFLLLASIANVGKAVGLTTYIATSPAFQQALSRGGNMADITAKSQAQHMVVDMAALGVSALATYATKGSERMRFALPLLVYPVCAVADLCAIFMELKAVQLRTLNRQRAEMIAEKWLATGHIPTAAEISSEERLAMPQVICGGVLPLRIVGADALTHKPDELLSLMRAYEGQQYMLTLARAPGQRLGRLLPLWLSRMLDVHASCDIRVSLSDTATGADIIAAVLEAAALRSAILNTVSSLARAPLTLPASSYTPASQEHTHHAISPPCSPSLHHPVSSSPGQPVQAASPPCCQPVSIPSSQPGSLPSSQPLPYPISSNCHQPVHNLVSPTCYSQSVSTRSSQPVPPPADQPGGTMAPAQQPSISGQPVRQRDSQTWRQPGAVSAADLAYIEAALRALSPAQLQALRQQGRHRALRDADRFQHALVEAGWKLRPFLLSTNEKQGYSRLPEGQALRGVAWGSGT